MTEPELPHWNASLAQPIVLRDGTELRTLHEAGALLERNFGAYRGVAYSAARNLLHTAAQTGRGADIVDARRMVVLLLEAEQML